MTPEEDLAGWKWKAEREEDEKLRLQAEVAVYRRVVIELSLEMSSSFARELVDGLREKAVAIHKQAPEVSTSLYSKTQLYLAQAYMSVAAQIPTRGA